MGQVEANPSGRLPIRLMDVLGTVSSSDRGNIIFTEGSSRGWDFHVISHTWSKGIRDLSVLIGKLVNNNRLQLDAEASQLHMKQILSASAKSSSSSTAYMQIEAGDDAYSLAFKDAADFSKVASYLELRDFLRLLAGDGVRYVWFDALCIDQTNLEEKSREINKMGSYYHRSQGCYVLVHGVGEGYQLWGKEGRRGAELPRWFSRVWTFQEFLLPRRLSFLVETLDPRFLGFVNKLARTKSKGGLCRCFCFARNVDYLELVKSICDSDPQVDASWAWEFELHGERAKSTSDSDAYEEEIELFNSGSSSKHSAKLPKNTWPNSGATSAVCTQCQSVPMIRKAQVYGANEVPSVSTMMSESSNDRTSIYLVDREAYLGVMQCDSKLAEPPLYADLKGVRDLRMLYAKLSSTGPWRAWDVVVEVGCRNCSVEEDRVLGILGLLGKAGGEVTQLRSGKRLQDQIRDVARVCSPEVLVELCSMDVRPCNIPGMSWAPDLHDHRRHDIWYTYVQSRLGGKQKSLSMEAYRESVSATGVLKLRAKVVSAHVLPITAFPSPILQSMPFFKPFKYPCSHLIVIPPPNPPGGSLPHLLRLQSHHVFSSTHLLQPDLSNHGLIPILCCDPDFESVSAPFINFKFHRFASGCTHGGSMHVPMSTSSCSNSLATENASASLPNLQHDAINRFDTDELRFQMEMVLLASTNALPTGKRLQLIMLCLKSVAATDHDQEQELHKIGMLYLTTDPEKDQLNMEAEERLHFESASMRECNIGGFGADVSAHLHFTTSTRS